MLIGGALLVEQACVIVWWCFMFSLPLFISCSIVLCGLPSPICLLPSGTLRLILVKMAYYFMGFFFPPSYNWLLPNDFVHSIIQHPMWFFFVTFSLPSPICIVTWWCSFCSCCNLMVSFPSLVLHSAPCLHAIIQCHSSILLFTFFSSLVGISFFIFF